MIPQLSLLHDARMFRARIDWADRTVTIDVVCDADAGELRQARLRASGLVYCSIEPPQISPADGYVPVSDEGLTIAAGEGVAPGVCVKFPETPEGAELLWIFVQDWNAFMHVCAEHFEILDS